MEALSLILWRERELLDTLMFKLEEEQLVLASGRTQWLARAAHEVEAVLVSVRETEALRAVAADEVAEQLGLAPNPTLRALVDALPEPWHTIFEDHRSAFLEVMRTIEELAETNRDLITSGFRSAREALLAVDEASAGYNHDGAAVSAIPRARLVDRTL